MKVFITGTVNVNAEIMVRLLNGNMSLALTLSIRVFVAVTLESNHDSIRSL